MARSARSVTVALDLTKMLSSGRHVVELSRSTRILITSFAAADASDVKETITQLGAVPPWVNEICEFVTRTKVFDVVVLKSVATVIFILSGEQLPLTRAA